MFLTPEFCAQIGARLSSLRTSPLLTGTRTLACGPSLPLSRPSLRRKIYSISSILCFSKSGVAPLTPSVVAWRVPGIRCQRASVFYGGSVANSPPPLATMSQKLFIILYFVFFRNAFSNSVFEQRGRASRGKDLPLHSEGFGFDIIIIPRLSSMMRGVIALLFIVVPVVEMKPFFDFFAPGNKCDISPSSIGL